MFDIERFLKEKEDYLQELYENKEIGNVNDIEGIERLISKEEDFPLNALREAIDEGNYPVIADRVFDLCIFCDTRLGREISSRIIRILLEPLDNPIQNYYGGSEEDDKEYKKKACLVRDGIIEGINKSIEDGDKLDEKIKEILTQLKEDKKQDRRKQLISKLEKFMNNKMFTSSELTELTDEITELDDLDEDIDSTLIETLRKLSEHTPVNKSQGWLIEAAEKCLQDKVDNGLDNINARIYRNL